MKNRSIKIKKIIVLFILLGVFFVTIFIIKDKQYLNQNLNQGIIDEKKQKELKKLINIDTLSDKFMDNYFDEVSNLEQKEKEKTLIVISDNKLDDAYGATKVIEAPNNQYFLVYDTNVSKNKALKKFKNNSDIVSVEENEIIKIDTIDEVGFGYNSWGIKQLGYDDAIDTIDSIKNKTPEKINDVVVAIIDSGLDIDEFNKIYNNRLFATYNVLSGGTDVTDISSHGTHVAGTIAETTPFNVKILAIKAGGDAGTFSRADLITAINYVVDEKKADVISYSIGGTSETQAYYQAIEAAKENNIIFVSSAGNNNTDTPHYPSDYDNTISVAAVDSRLEKTWFSNYGKFTTFAAPGFNIKSVSIGTKDTSIKSGTSMATPHVTGAVAILKSFNKDLTLNDTIELLKKHAIDIGDNGWDKHYGYGVVNFEDAIFCDENVECDEYGVFEQNEVSTFSTIKIESNNSFTPKYNYGNITNIMDAEINLYYTEDNYYTKTLSQLIDDIEIFGYNPYGVGEQNVNIKYKNFETNLIIQNNELEMGWDYNSLDTTQIELKEIFNYENLDEYSTYYFTDLSQVIKVPNEYNGRSVISIGDNLFKDKVYKSRSNLKRIEISNGIKNIGSQAFAISTDKLAEIKDKDPGPIEIVIPESVESIADNAFQNRKRIVCYVHKNSKGYEYAVEKNKLFNQDSITDNKFDYVYVDSINVDLLKSEYKAFDKIDEKDLLITVSYNGSLELEDEIINNYNIKYLNSNDSFRYGDTKFIIEFETKKGQQISQEVNVTVNKAQPEYNVPKDLKGKIDQVLGSIQLPKGFEWQDSTLVLDKLGENKFLAKYDPEDKENYSIVENIELKVYVEKKDSNIIYTSSGNTTKYDGKEHGINLNVESPNNVIIKYMDIEGNYTLDEMPKYINLGKYVIKYKLFIDDKHTEILGEEILEIINNKINNNTTDKGVYYDGKEHTIDVNIELKQYDIKYSINNINYNINELPKFKDVGEHTIYYKVTAYAHDELIASNNIKIYGIKSIESPLIQKDNILIVKDNKFSSLTNNIKTCAEKTQYIHMSKDGNLIYKNDIKTGEIINIMLNDSKNNFYNISVLGDINSDGKVSSADYVKIKKHIMKSEFIENKIYFYSADVNSDNKISSADYVKIRKYIMNGDSL